MDKLESFGEQDANLLHDDVHASGRSSFSRRRSSSSTSAISDVLESLKLNGAPFTNKSKDYRYSDFDDPLHQRMDQIELEEADEYPTHPANSKWMRLFWAFATILTLAWLFMLFILISSGASLHRSKLEHDPDATVSMGSGMKVTLGEIQAGMWFASSHAISWINGPNDEDGYLLERDSPSEDYYLIVKDVRTLENTTTNSHDTIYLMKEGGFKAGDEYAVPDDAWPSPDLKTVLLITEKEKNWRHSYYGRYWLFDVGSQKAEPLDPSNVDGRVQLAVWSPNSDAVVFVRENNLYLRRIDEERVIQITEDGSAQMFNGVPDWVYEEEVFSGNKATWWSKDAKYIAFLATNESMVPEFPIEYFISRPSGKPPKPGLERYPETRKIKYPKAGAPNPIVHVRLYDVESNSLFDVPIDDDFEDETRLITEVVWAGKTGKVLVRETNRESDFLKMVLIDAKQKTGRGVRSQDVEALDGGWFEITESTTFVPADPDNGRPDDGYLDMVIYDGYDHLGYFTPLDNAEPRMLTSGEWEVVDAPSAIDLKNNLVYFKATKESSTERHLYRVGLDGKGLEPMTDISSDGYYGGSFSKSAGFCLLSYDGPKIPWQKVVSTPSNSEAFEHVIEENEGLAQLASEHELPLLVYSTISIDGYDLNVIERRPPHFDERKNYPVVFYLYAGPISQTVDKRFKVDFQSYLASSLGYVVVTVDGRGTGFRGRKNRVIVRDNLGYWEAHDQIYTAKEWAKKKYVDASRMAIWGWSYGGYMTLKTLEQDAGETFKYGMAVAPVTDWRFYDTIYTERWMHTPQHNQAGYANASISNVAAIGKTTRFLILHGASDDNVHFQNTLTLLDKLDLARIENYDVHVFPDSDHSIYFHNANRIVYDKLSWWLINAFNGEWARIEKPVPLKAGKKLSDHDYRAVK